MSKTVKEPIVTGKICCGCGKFVRTYLFDMKDYAYKKNGRFFCSYGCYNRYCIELEEAQKSSWR